MTGTHDAQANIGVVGLAVMGSNLARNLASRAGNTVAVYNRSAERTDLLVAEHPEAGFVAAKSIEEFAASLQRPRTAIIMVQAGRGTDAVIDQLSDAFEPGDIIVDGGNSLFTDTIRRQLAANARGLEFVGTGISGLKTYSGSYKSIWKLTGRPETRLNVTSFQSSSVGFSTIAQP